MEPVSDWPVSIIQYVRDQIKQHPLQSISFAAYMDACLYHPQYGYYMQPNFTIGKSGDFYTSSSVHPVFAKVFARLATEITEVYDQPLRFCEVGPGDGRFARFFLDELQRYYPRWYETSQYMLIERSATARECQKQQLYEHLAHVFWGKEGSLREYRGIIFCNELLDAFAVHIVQKRHGQLNEVRVGWCDESQSFVERDVPLENNGLLEYLEQFEWQLEDGQRLEVPLAALEWVEHVGETIAEGLWFIIDYGYTDDELFLPIHRDGSLLTYDQHQVNERVFERPGKKDITTHVPFDRIMGAAAKHGWEKRALFRQTEFLWQAGITDWLTDHLPTEWDSEKAKQNRAIRYLLSPEAISASFRVLVLEKGGNRSHVHSFLTTDEPVHSAYRNQGTSKKPLFKR